MKNYLVLVTIILFVTFGCKKKAETSTDPITQTVNFEISIPQTFAGITFTVTEITDNRCPNNAVYVLAGKALVSLEVKSNLETKNLKLCIGGDCNYAGITDNLVFTIGTIKYKVTLVNVTPFPQQATLPKVAILKII